MSRMTRERLCEILDKMPACRVGIIGDLCLDAYWHADMTKSELSRETPFFPIPVTEERYSAGSAGNVACNLHALLTHSPKVLGVIGDDWRGDMLRRVFRKQGIDTDAIVASETIMTNAYIKPIRHGFGACVVESERIDFVNCSVIGGVDEEKLLAELAAIEGKVDVLCVSDQMEFGCITPRVREAICAMGARGMRIIVDSRDRIHLYSNVILKPNELEGARALNGVLPKEGQSREELAEIARALAVKTNCRVLMTMGGSGSVFTDGNDLTFCNPFKVGRELDICGAGDTFMSGMACALAAGAEPGEAMQIANLASSITIQKIGITGTATKAEMLAAWDMQ